MEQIKTTITVNKNERQEIADDIKYLFEHHNFTPGLKKALEEMLHATGPTVAQLGFNYRDDTDRLAIYAPTSRVVTMKGPIFGKDGELEGITFLDTDGYYKKDDPKQFTPLYHDNRPMKQVAYTTVPDDMRDSYSLYVSLLAVVDFGPDVKGKNGIPVEPMLAIVYRHKNEQRPWAIMQLFNRPLEGVRVPSHLRDDQVEILGRAE